MGLLDSFMSASLFAKISFILLLLADFLNFLGFTTPAWGKNYSTPAQKDWRGYGLWRSCSSTDSPNCIPLDGWAKEWHGAVQAFAVFGFVGINVALLLIILYIWVDACGCKGNKENCVANAILCIVTGICYLIAICIYGAKWEDDLIGTSLTGAELSWSFGLTIVAMLLELVAGVVLIVEWRKGKGVSASG